MCSFQVVLIAINSPLGHVSDGIWCGLIVSLIMLAGADPGGCRGGHGFPSNPVEISHKGGHIDFMFLAPPHPAAGSDAVLE